MNVFKKFVLPAIIAAVVLVILIVFRTVPASKLWKGYSVLYVPAHTEQNKVESVLANNGCKEWICLNNQKLAFENGLLPVLDKDDSEYCESRSLWFFDRDRKADLYYIPDTFYRQAKNSVEALIADYHLDAGLDSRSSFPVITPLVCLAVFILLILFAKNKFFYLVAGIFPVILAFSMPFNAQAACICLYLYAVFLVQHLWNKTDALETLKKIPQVYIFGALPIIASFFVNWVSGLFFILCVTGGLSLSFIYYNYVVIHDSKLRFQPVQIVPSRLLNTTGIKNTRRLIFPLAGILVLLGLYYTSADVFSITRPSDLYFPAPVGYNNKNGIACLDDYYLWLWNKTTSPYRSLNESYSQIPSAGEVFETTVYVKTDNGVETQKQVVAVFDDEFKRQAKQDIANLDYPAVEKLMVSQGKNFYVDYSGGSGEKFSMSGMVIMILGALLCIVVLTLSLFRSRKNENFI